MKRFSAVVLPVAVLALAGCGASSSTASSRARSRANGVSSTTAASTGTAPGTVSVVMQNINFNPTTIHVKVGETVTWTNRDDAPHNVTYASGPTFASSPTFTRGESWSLKLTKPGLIRYFCTIHPGMDGSIVVGR
jgi:amicyanin